MSTPKILFFILPMALFLSASAHGNTQAEVRCGQVSGSIDWKYCFTPGTSKNSKKLILHFHGGGLSEQTLFEGGGYGGELRRYAKDLSLDAPSIVAISLGPMWLLTKKSPLPQSGLYEVFKNEILPYIEDNLVGGNVQERVAIGESMGGFNAGTFAFQNSALFTKVALLCPLLGFEKLTTKSDMADYIAKTGADPQYAQFLFGMRDQFFSTPEEEFTASPLTLIQNLTPHEKGPELFVTCGDRDQFGFFYGSQLFAKRAVARGFKTTWKPVPGGAHCSVDVEALAKFLFKP